MKDFKKLKGNLQTYNSFEELGKAWNCKPRIKQTKDKEKLKKQREDFCNRYRCKGCGQPMKYLGQNVMVCANENCKGIKEEKTDLEGNVSVTYHTSYLFLNRRSAEIAENIFYETE